MSNRHLLIISVPGFHRRIPCTSLNSFALFHSLCLSDSVFVRSHPCFSRQGSLNDRSDSLSAFVIVWLCRSSMRCKHRTSWTTSRVSLSLKVRRQDVESSGFNLWRSFNHNPWQWGSRSFFVSCGFSSTSILEPPFATECHTNLPSSSIPKHHQRRSCPSFVSHNSILGNAQHCFCSIMMTNEDSLSHAACK